MTSTWIIPAFALLGAAAFAQETTPEPDKQPPSEAVAVVRPAPGKCVVPIKNFMPKNHFSRMPQVPAPTEIDPKIVKDPPLPVCDEVDNKKLRSFSPATPQNNRFPKLKILPNK